ncbi:MAG: type 4a pilus biogenesis protein PilO [Methylacidiphilales bacterium]|nr:type 4a pilus biogenesis protein PilO [Candidatus Methylacidiphilales bacterium]
MKLNFALLLEQLKSIDSDKLKKIGSLSLEIRIIFLAIEAIIVTVVLYVLLIIPQINSISNLSSTIEKKKSDYQLLAQKAPNLNLFQKQIDEMEQTFKVLLTLLPVKVDISEVLRDITDVAGESDVKIDQFSPGEKEISKEFYAEQPIKLSISGSYHSLGKFVSELALTPRIITLGDFTLAPSGKSNSLNEKILKITVVAKTYRYVAN